jgi:hypothetical protein
MPRCLPAPRRVIVAALYCLTGSEAGIGVRAEPDPIRFNTNFEGASLGKIEQVGELAYRCHVKGQYNEQGRNRQASWFYFRIDGARNRDLTLTMTDYVGEYNGKPGACPMGPNMQPVASDDGEHWQPISEVTWDDRAKEAVLRVRPQNDTIWIAHQPPYTASRLVRLLQALDQCDDARIEIIGKTARGRDLHKITVTAADVHDREKATIWLQARQHAWESGTSFVMEGALRFITSGDPRARALRRGVVFVFTPMADPDGCAIGEVRFNANGFDLNRHWNEVDLRDKRYLAAMPEIWYVKKAIAAHVASGRKIDLMINLHNTETGEYLATRASDDRSRAVVGKLSERLVRETSFQPSHGPVFGAVRDGSALALFDELGVLILLLEQRIANDPRTGRPPSVEDRIRFGEQLIAIMGETVVP